MYDTSSPAGTCRVLNWSTAETRTMPFMSMFAR